MDDDPHNLRTLSIFHYVLAGVVAFFSLFPLIHVGIGILMLSGAMTETSSKPPAPEEQAMLRWMGALFIAVAAVIILLGEALAVCLFLTARNLNRRQHHRFCLVISGVECLFMPLGTILGVFTIMALVKPEVKALFGLPVRAASPT